MEDAEAVLVALGPQIEWTHYVQEEGGGHGYVGGAYRYSYTTDQHRKEPGFCPRFSSGAPWALSPKYYLTEAEAKAACERHHATGQWEREQRNTVLVADARRDLRHTISAMAGTRWGVLTAVCLPLEEASDALLKVLPFAEKLSAAEMQELLERTAAIKTTALAQHERNTIASHCPAAAQSLDAQEQTI